MTSASKWLLALVRPDLAVDEWRPALRVVVGVVAVLAVVNMAGVFAGTLAVEGSVTGSVPVDNPNYPGDPLCEEDDASDLITTSGALDDAADACATEPRTVQRSLDSFVRNAASGALAAAFLVPVIEWLLVAGVVRLLVKSSDYEEFNELLTIAAWGTIPAVLRYVLRPVFVTLTVRSWEYSGSVDALEAATRTFVTAVGMPLFTVVVAVTLLWQAAIYVVGFTKHTDASLQRIVVICVLLAVLLAVTSVFGTAVPVPSVAGYALLLLLLGAPNVVFPYGITRLGERLDAVGSTTHWSDVEPAEWNVRLTRAMGLLFLCIAFWLLGGILLM